MAEDDFGQKGIKWADARNALEDVNNWAEDIPILEERFIGNTNDKIILEIIPPEGNIEGLIPSEGYRLQAYILRENGNIEIIKTYNNARQFGADGKNFFSDISSIDTPTNVVDDGFPPDQIEGEGPMESDTNRRFGQNAPTESDFRNDLIDEELRNIVSNELDDINVRNLTDQQLYDEFVNYSKTTLKAEKFGDLTPELLNIQQTQDWETFSRARGYTEQEISDFKRYLDLSAEMENRFPGKDGFASLAEGINYELQHEDSITTLEEWKKFNSTDTPTNVVDYQDTGVGGRPFEIKDGVPVDKSGNPIKSVGAADETITIYRVVPEGVDSVNANDWVFINKGQAEEALKNANANTEGNFNLIEIEVNKGDVYPSTRGNLEMGYFPKDTPPNVVDDVTPASVVDEAVEYIDNLNIDNAIKKEVKDKVIKVTGQASGGIPIPGIGQAIDAWETAVLIVGAAALAAGEIDELPKVIYNYGLDLYESILSGYNIPYQPAKRKEYTPNFERISSGLTWIDKLQPTSYIINPVIEEFQETAATTSTMEVPGFGTVPASEYYQPPVQSTPEKDNINTIMTNLMTNISNAQGAYPRTRREIELFGRNPIQVVPQDTADKPEKVEYDSKEKQNLHDIYAELYKNLSNASARIQ
jgi:hypothetical protein